MGWPGAAFDCRDRSGRGFRHQQRSVMCHKRQLDLPPLRRPCLVKRNFVLRQPFGSDEVIGAIK
jgi:hypothetical protein